MCINRTKVTKRKPKNWFENGYKIIVAYPFKWRTKLGKVECDCKEVMEMYQPWYGFSFFHSDGCAIEKHVKRYPGINNLVEYSGCFAQSD